MFSYEIRLRKYGRQSDAVYCVRKTSDFAAVRNALKIAESGDGVEVWKGAECIYADHHQLTPAPQ